MELAIIAHDAMKNRMMEFLESHLSFFNRPDIQIIATGTTGGLAQDRGFNVTRFLSGPLGGDAQIAGRVAEGKTQLVIFFKDPLANHPHEADISMLIRVCDVHNVPLATNRATAEAIIKSIVQQ
jgi:methylglyoxal synthase